jgi:hypothetical protein
MMAEATAETPSGPSQHAFIANVHGTAEPHRVLSAWTKDTINCVDYAQMKSKLAEQGEFTVQGRVYNAPDSTGPYVLIPTCGDVWEVPRADGSVLLLYPSGKQIWKRTYLHVPPGHYVDCRIRYVPDDERRKIAQVPADAGDWSAYSVLDEGAVISAQGLFAEHPKAYQSSERSGGV